MLFEMANRELAIHIERQIDSLCDQFEQQLQRGIRPQIEHYLGNVPAMGRSRLLLELLRMTVEYAGCKPKRVPGPSSTNDADGRGAIRWPTPQQSGPRADPGSDLAPPRA